MLRFIYTIFVGILVVAFIGVGIDAFYPAPTAPVTPQYRCVEPMPVDNADGATKPTCGEPTQEQIDQDQASWENYQGELAIYNRNVSMMTIAISVVILAISLIFAEQLQLVSDGFILGGILTLMYGIIRGFQAEDPKFRFITVAVGLIVALALGYLKFVKPSAKITSTST